jgi:heat shock protein HslJ
MLASLYGSELLKGTSITLDVKSDDIGGSTGCNTYGGKTTMEEGTFKHVSLQSPRRVLKETSGNRKKSIFAL